jgi:hypothetical protein
MFDKIFETNVKSYWEFVKDVYVNTDLHYPRFKLPKLTPRLIPLRSLINKKKIIMLFTKTHAISSNVTID